MKVAVATSAADQFGGVFAQAYLQAGGVPPEMIVVQAQRPEIGFRGMASVAAAWKLFGPRGTLRVLAARKLGVKWCQDDWAKGLGKPWIESLAGAQTEVVGCRSINDPEVVARLRECKPDLLVSLGSPFIIKRPVLELARVGAVNLHNARLPKYRGHFGTFWEVMNGETQSCVTLHEMVPKVDMGRVLRSESVNVSDCPTFIDLMLRKKEVGGRLLAEFLRDVERTGVLPAGEEPSAESGYYDFPTTEQLMQFSYPACKTQKAAQ